MKRCMALFAAAMMVLAGCSGGVSQESYDKINTGMSVASVEGILGSGQEQSAGGTGISSGGVITGSTPAANTKTYLWKDGDMKIIVDFKDGVVVNKRKMGF